MINFQLIILLSAVVGYVSAGACVPCTGCNSINVGAGQQVTFIAGGTPNTCPDGVEVIEAQFATTDGSLFDIQNTGYANSRQTQQPFGGGVDIECYDPGLSTSSPWGITNANGGPADTIETIIICNNAVFDCPFVYSLLQQCVTCTRDCAGKICGDDGCGGFCGACGIDEVCVDNSCQPICVPDCAGKECGNDGCGSNCGTCDSGETCTGGQCVVDCVPNCDNDKCGSDGCGGSCGVCTGDCTSGVCEMPSGCYCECTCSEKVVGFTEFACSEDALCDSTHCTNEYPLKCQSSGEVSALFVEFGDDGGGGSEPSGGQIAGIVVGVAAAAGAIGGITYYAKQRQQTHASL